MKDVYKECGLVTLASTMISYAPLELNNTPFDPDMEKVHTL